MITPEKSDSISLGSILPRKEPVQERSRVRFEKILEVFLELTIRKGVDVVSMKDVAKSAQISIASLYQYFPDKAALVATLADRYNQEGEHCVKSIMSEVTEPEDLYGALAAILDEYYSFFKKVPGSYAIWQATQSDTRLHQLEEKHCDQVTQILAKTFTRITPSISKEKSWSHASLYSVLIASVVRKAITLSESEAEEIIAIYRNNHLRSSVDIFLKG